MKRFLAGLFALCLVACDSGPVAQGAQDEMLMLARKKQPSVRLPGFVINDVTVAESSGIATLTITKSGQTRSASTITVTTVSGTADESDYTAEEQTVIFSANQTSQNVSIQLVNDTTPEDTEYFSVRLTAGSNALIKDQLGKVTITDSDVGGPTTQTCPDGSVIPIDDECNIPPEEPDTPDWEDSPTLNGAADIASNFDINLTLNVRPAHTPGEAAPDVVGAFRFICGAGQLLYDDPIVYPGQPGESHLHQFYGNLDADADSTYASLRGGGDSTCSSDGAGHAPNRSAYWMPAMLDGKGHVVKPDYVAIYYKRRPEDDPKCQSVGGTAKGEGNCVILPNGLKFIFGYDMVTGKTPTGEIYFNCTGTGSNSAHYPTIVAAAAGCVTGGRIGAIIRAPGCWDGTHLDSPNHRDHVAYTSYGTWGYNRCPTTHPYRIPAFQLQAWYSVEAGDDLSLWSLSSDAMHPELPHGSTFHADFFMAWDPLVKEMWHENCINLLLNCSSGDLGNLKGLKGATVPSYNGVTAWKNPQRLVAIP